MAERRLQEVSDEALRENRVFDGNEQTDFGRDQFVAALSSTAEIGPEGGTVDVGRCSVKFRPGTFSDVTRVHVTAKVDSSEWPDGREAITPSLDINVGGELEVEAIVRLPTWVMADTQLPRAHIMHYSETSNQWEVIDEVAFGHSSFIEFKCKKFSRIIAAIAGLLSLPVSFLFQPSIFVSGQNFVFCLHLDNEIIYESFSKHLKKQLCRNNDYRHLTFNCIDCVINDVVEGRVFCVRPATGFTFNPPGPFLAPINRRLLFGGRFSRRCALWGKSDGQGVVIQTETGKIGNLESNAFHHIWEPAKTISSPDGIELSASYDAESSSQKVEYESTQNLQSSCQSKATPVATSVNKPNQTLSDVTSTLAASLQPAPKDGHTTIIAQNVHVHNDRRFISAGTSVDGPMTSISSGCTTAVSSTTGQTKDSWWCNLL